MKTINAFVALIIISAVSVTTFWSIESLANPIDAGVTPSEQEEPTVTATAQSKRPVYYVNPMVVGAVLYEDGDNRVTSHDAQSLLGAGLAVRGGVVIEDRHLFGLLFQGYWRSTQAVLDQWEGDRHWGAVSTYYLGPEYRYFTDTGIYFGVSSGLAFTFADDHVGEDSPNCSSWDCLDNHLERSDDHAALGVGFRGTIGYEYRFSRNLAINAEAFAGWLVGDDENEETLSTPMYGVAIGLGI